MSIDNKTLLYTCLYLRSVALLMLLSLASCSSSELSIGRAGMAGRSKMGAGSPGCSEA